jgi:hypothetical protein
MELHGCVLDFIRLSAMGVAEIAESIQYVEKSTYFCIYSVDHSDGHLQLRSVLPVSVTNALLHTTVLYHLFQPSSSCRSKRRGPELGEMFERDLKWLGFLYDCRSLR